VEKRDRFLGMSSEERRAARRATWQGGIAASFAELDVVDADQWEAVPAIERLKAVWSLVEDSLALRGEHGPTPRRQRLVGGVRPLKG
jgi:hypothetical protein